MLCFCTILRIELFVVDKVTNNINEWFEAVTVHEEVSSLELTAGDPCLVVSIIMRQLRLSAYTPR